MEPVITLIHLFTVLTAFMVSIKAGNNPQLIPKKTLFAQKDSLQYGINSNKINVREGTAKTCIGVDYLLTM